MATLSRRNPVTHHAEVQAGERFEFGANWARFLKELDERRIEWAEKSLLRMLDLPSLAGLRFLDIGSGSGLFSLAARRLGASVHSFDYDPRSVACTATLRERYFGDDPDWTVEEGSVLDEEYLASLGRFDIVYSWGVLHHTGALWDALSAAAQRVAPGGKLYLSIYNDQGPPSRRWRSVKAAYNRVHPSLRFVILAPAFLRLWGITIARDTARGRPLASWRRYAEQSGRGMSPWRDVVDWVGGYPFEVARPEEVFNFLKARGFMLSQMVTCGGGLGCNEFVFESRE